MEGREREGPQVTDEPGPLRDLLRHCFLLPITFPPPWVRQEIRYSESNCIKDNIYLC